MAFGLIDLARPSESLVQSEYGDIGNYELTQFRIDSFGQMEFRNKLKTPPISTLIAFNSLIDPPSISDNDPTNLLERIWQQKFELDKEYQNAVEAEGGPSIDSKKLDAIGQEFRDKEIALVEDYLHRFYGPNERNVYRAMCWMSVVNGGQLRNALYSNEFKNVFGFEIDKSKEKSLMEVAKKSRDELGIRSRQLLKEYTVQIFKDQVASDSLNWLDDLLDTYVPPLELLLLD